ncbi:hypothetical protein T11_14382 [Trichinella zimbabwensis]|uniref:Uncharacterized protein n=1 Tax=Trichinella zimbabwensis TaxID=268475 RepID=A0A0V1HGJ3_9BILA|nr:hypothetical protein T11_14382 [Trichinella zimbabwensis]
MKKRSPQRNSFAGQELQVGRSKVNWHRREERLYNVTKECYNGRAQKQHMLQQTWEFQQSLSPHHKVQNRANHLH